MTLTKKTTAWNLTKNIKNFIKKLKLVSIENCSLRDLLKWSQSIVQQCIEKFQLEEGEADEEWRKLDGLSTMSITTLKFVNEQLKLVAFEKKKFSPAVIRLSMLMKFHSSSRYRAVRESGFLILPYETTLSSYTVPKRECGINDGRLIELCQVAESLLPTKREVSVIFDEMALQPNANFDASGKIEGFAINQKDSAPLATSMLCFMIQGLKENFHDVVSFHPDADFLKASLYQVLFVIMKAGFEPVMTVRVFTNRFQQDPIEEHFSQQRMRSGFSPSPHCSSCKQRGSWPTCQVLTTTAPQALYVKQKGPLLGMRSPFCKKIRCVAGGCMASYK